jgi:hypothetical protein
LELSKLIYRKALIVVSVFCFSVSNTIAANVDFKYIYNNESESCNNNQTDKDYANSKDGVASTETNKTNNAEAPKLMGIM